jgi:2'-5' RNA ligase
MRGVSSFRFQVSSVESRAENGQEWSEMPNDNPAPLFRLFIAIQIPETARDEMLRVQRQLRQFVESGDVRWTNPDQIHLTLKFLGNVPAGSVEAVKQSLAEACARIRPFHLRAKGIGFFPDSRSPRVIWVGFEGGENGLADLQSRVEKSLSPFAEKPGAEKFLAHATLGRFQKFRRHKTEKLLPHALSFAGHVFGDWRVEEVGLFRSELSPAGARHVLLAGCWLGMA